MYLYNTTIELGNVKVNNLKSVRSFLIQGLLQ